MYIPPKTLPLHQFIQHILFQNKALQLIQLDKRKQLFEFLRVAEQQLFVIVVRDQARTVIAQAKDVNEILSDWQWAEKQILPLVQGDDDKALSDLVERLTVQQLSQEIRNEADRKQRHFQALFPNLATCRLLGSFSAVLWAGVRPHRGRLYFTTSTLSFHEGSDTEVSASSTPNGSKSALTIHVYTITSIDRHGPIPIVHPVKITTLEASYLFSILDSRDEFCDILALLWDLALDQIILREEEILKFVIALQYVGTSVEQQHMQVIQASSPAPVYSLINKRWKLKSTRDALTLKMSSVYQREFHLPKWETLTARWPAIMKTEDVQCGGHMYLSKSFLCFASEASNFRVIIPLIEANDVQTDNALRQLHIHTPAHLFVFDVENAISDAYVETHLVWRLARLNITQDRAKFFDELYLRNEKLEMIRDMSSKQGKVGPAPPPDPAALAAWKQFFIEQGHGFTFVRNDRFEALVKAGIPDELRGAIWQMMAGSMYLRFQLEEYKYYSTLLSSNASKTSLAVDEIERDVHRSLPELPFYKSGEGIPALRRVLIAYSWHNPENGYTQAMNILAAFFLLYMSEEAAFYLLCIICDDMLPGSYSPAMIGALVDQKVFEDVLKEHLPKVAEQFEAKNVPLSAISMPWYITLYIGYLPLQVTLRILDHFFLRGVEVLVQSALAVLKVFEGRILAEDDGYVIATFLKDSVHIDADTLLFTIFDTFGDYRLPDFDKRRSLYRVPAIAELQASNKRSLVSDLAQHTKFTVAELNSMHADVEALTSGQSSAVVNFEQFSELMFRQAPSWWSRLPSEIRRAIFSRLLRKEGKQAVTFYQMVTGLSPWMKGTIRDRFLVCVDVVDSDHDRKLTFQQLATALDLLVKLHRADVPADIKAFVQMIFDKLERPAEGLVTIEEVQAQVIDLPLFAEFFGIPSPSKPPRRTTRRPK